MLGEGFFQTNFDFLAKQFGQNFYTLVEMYCCPELKFEKIFHRNRSKLIETFYFP